MGIASVNLSAAKGHFKAAITREVLEAYRRFYLAVYLAWSDTRTRYRRSVLGPFWLVLGTAIGVGGLGIVWGTLFQVDRAVFIPSLTIGLVTWYLLSGCVIESAGVFYHNRELLLSMPSSSLLISIQLLLRQVVNFGHNFVVVIIVLTIFPHNLSWASFLAIPGFFVVCFNMLWIIQLVGYFGARFRDLEPLLGAVMQPLFFVTPVMFRSSQLGAASLIVELNPFTYWLGLIRDPLMGTAPSLLTWGLALGLGVVGWAAALYITGTKRHRLPYWVH